MKRKAIGNGAYVSEDGRYWERVGTTAAGRTWRLMRNVETKREAVRIASARDPQSVGRKFSDLATAYKSAKCPNATLKPRPPEFCTEEEARVDRLAAFFGSKPADKISIADIPAYYAHRVAQMPQGRTGSRAVDKETQTLSNIFRYAVVARLFPHNPVATGRPRYQSNHEIKHSRERAPKSADIIHQLAGELLSTVETEVSGWFCLFAMFSGCRVSEVIKFRLDARNENEAGFVQWRRGVTPENQPLGLLHLKRLKRGMNPETLIGKEFAEMLIVFEKWHTSRFPESPWYFPNCAGNKISRRKVYEHITLATKRLNLPLITPHGFRSYYVTKRRSDGATDTVIAGEIGDRTVGLMQTTYGERPKNWLGGDPLTWLPKNGKTAWNQWNEKFELDYGCTTEPVDNAGNAIESSMPVWRNGRRTGLKRVLAGGPIKTVVAIKAFSLDFRNPNIEFPQ